jgi:catechol 2,3-dioxygenase-like lactoylglutathione lyase family enzyme
MTRQSPGCRGRACWVSRFGDRLSATLIGVHMTSESTSLSSVEQPSLRTPPLSARVEEPDSPRLSTAVMFVHKLDASVHFYREVLRMEVTVRESSAALLVNAGSFQLYLREMGPRSSHLSGAIGVQYVIWTASSSEDLDRFERVLNEHCRRVVKQVIDGVTFIEGRDPDGVPVVITYPGPDQAARHAIMRRVYFW